MASEAIQRLPDEDEKKQAVAWIQSFPKPGLQEGGENGLTGPVLVKKKKSQLVSSRDGETMRRDKEESIPKRDEGGSAPNSVRKFVAPGFNNSEEVTRSALIYLLFSFFQENKSFGVQPFALILCQYVADIAYGTLMFNTINVSPSNHLR